jgi:hypothetical protein
MDYSKFENNEVETIYVVLANTTMDKVHVNYQFICGTRHDDFTKDISDANHYETVEESKNIICNHEFCTKGIGRLWGAQLHIAKYEKTFGFDKYGEYKISYSEIESVMIWQK